MGLREQLKAIVDEVNGLVTKAKAENRDFTDTEAARIAELKPKADELKGKIAAADEAQAAAKAMAGMGEPDDDAAGGAHAPDNSGPAPDRARSVSAFMERFVKSDPYETFRKQYPSGVGSGSPVDIGRVKVASAEEWFSARRRKATLTTEIAHDQPVRLPTVDVVDRDRLTLLDLISRGQMAGNSFEYVQVIGYTRNAAIVDEGGLKPLSDIQTDLADAKAFTYADGYDVTNQLLADAPAFASYMQNELSYSLDNVIEHYLLNGTGTGGTSSAVATFAITSFAGTGRVPCTRWFR